MFPSFPNSERFNDGHCERSEANVFISAKPISCYSRRWRIKSAMTVRSDEIILHKICNSLKTRVNAIMKLLDLGRKYKAYFEPNAMPISELYNDNPFIQEILRTGIELR